MKKTVENDFEHLLRNSADEIRLRPSPKVWKGINARLHRRKKVYAAAGSLLLLLTLSVALYNPSARNNNSAVAGAQQNDAGNNIGKKESSSNPPASDITPPVQPFLDKGIAITGNDRNAQRTAPSNERNDNAAVTPPSGSNEAYIPVTEAVIVPIDVAVVRNSTQPAANNTGVANAFVETEVALIRNDLGGNGEPENMIEEAGNNKQPITSFTNAQRNEPVENNNAEKLAANDMKHADKNNPENKIDKQDPLLLKGIAGNDIQVKQKPRKWLFEFYAFPSISYRKLTDSRSKTDPNATSKEDFDKAVYHKPSFGLEAGVSWHLRIYDRFNAKAGIQLNYNRFNMKATLAPQPEVATIVLYGNNRDVYNTSNLRTSNDRGLPEWIRNKNLQISIPVGFEVALTSPSKGNTTLNIGATAQPSYLLGNKNYMLSTDLKNYTMEPTLIRKFNMNFGFETFFAFETDKLRWHIGPQLRYQLFSTYNKAYPIRENLIDYTFKVSISKPF